MYTHTHTHTHIYPLHYVYRSVFWTGHWMPILRILWLFDTTYFLYWHTFYIDLVYVDSIIATCRMCAIKLPFRQTSHERFFPFKSQLSTYQLFFHLALNLNLPYLSSDYSIIQLKNISQSIHIIIHPQILSHHETF